MNNNYLIKLARQILSVKSGLSKVQFAKIIYFVHKGLILKELSNSQDLGFIRMPLGPVPIGFKDLTEANTGIYTREEKTDYNLAYNAQLYFLRESLSENISNDHYETVKELVNNLLGLKTSELVEISHREPSWLQRSNSSEFYISQEDLKNDLPNKKPRQIDDDFDKQRLQAFLLSGMINEVVDESSSLEYPD